MLKISLQINPEDSNKTDITIHFTDSSLMSENNYVILVGDEWSRIPNLINRDVILGGKDTYDENLTFDFKTNPEKLEYTKEAVRFVVNNFDYFINLAYYDNTDKIITDLATHFSTKREFKDERKDELHRIVNGLITEILKINTELVTNHPFIKSEPFYNSTNYNAHERDYLESNITHNPSNDTFIGVLGGQNSLKVSYLKGLLGFSNSDLIIPSSQEGFDLSTYNTIVRYLTTDKFIPEEFKAKGGKFHNHQDRPYVQKITVYSIKYIYTMFIAPYLNDIITNFKSSEVYTKFKLNEKFENENDVLKIRALFNNISDRNFYTFLDLVSCQNCFDVLKDFVDKDCKLEHNDVLEINSKLSKIFFERSKTFRNALYQKYKEFIQPCIYSEFGQEDYFGNITFKFYLSNPAKDLNYLLKHITNPIMSYDPEDFSLLGFIKEVYFELDKHDNLKINNINNTEIYFADEEKNKSYSDTDRSLVFINIQNIDHDPYEITFKNQVSKTSYINFSLLRKCGIILLLKDINIKNDKDFKRQLFTLDLFGLKDRTIVCSGVQEHLNTVFSGLYKREIADIERNLKVREGKKFKSLDEMSDNDPTLIDLIISKMRKVNGYKLNNTDIINFIVEETIQKFNEIPIDNNEVDILKFNMSDILGNKYKTKLDLMEEFELSENNLDFYSVDSLLNNVIYQEKLEFFYEGHIIDLSYYVFNILAEKILECIKECAEQELFNKLTLVTDIKLTEANKGYLLSIIKIRTFKVIVKYISRVLLLRYKHEFYNLKRDLDYNTSSIFKIDRRVDKLIQDMYTQNGLENIILEIVVNSTNYVAQNMSYNG